MTLQEKYGEYLDEIATSRAQLEGSPSSSLVALDLRLSGIDSRLTLWASREMIRRGLSPVPVLKLAWPEHEWAYSNGTLYYDYGVVLYSPRDATRKVLVNLVLVSLASWLGYLVGGNVLIVYRLATVIATVELLHTAFRINRGIRKENYEYPTV